jgi:leucine dehydrogenase
VFVSDINKQALASLDEPVTFVDNRSIHKLKVDVYAPCALGACLNDETIPDMGATIIAGAANNQLQKEEQGLQALNARGILFAPDFIINAGGLINVFEELKGYNHSSARKSVEGIFDTLIEVFHQSEVKGISTLKAAHQMAHLRIARGKTDLCQTYDNQDWILR